MKTKGQRRLDIGTRITVYWPSDDQWYTGTVDSEAMNDEDSSRIMIKYDDGDQKWMDINADKWRRSTKPDRFIKRDTQTKRDKQEKIDRLDIGSKLSVWWPHEKEFYTGTLTKILEEKGGSDGKVEPHHITYDDGDEEWTNLLFRDFRTVPPKAERLKVGYHVSVYNENEKKYYPATIVEIAVEKAKPHKLEYEKKKEESEWVNLNVHPFLDIEEISHQTKKRKREFYDTPAPKPKPPMFKKEEDKCGSSIKCKEICALCETHVKRPRAASCHHIFCKSCIKQHLKSLVCPICKSSVTSTFKKYDAEHASYKSVEALSMTTAEVLLTFSSASSASRDKKFMFIPCHIIDACQSKKRDEREHRGYYWRFQGSHDRILRAGEGVKEGYSIEQVDLQTREIIKVFPSARKAYEKTGVSRCSIRRVLERRGKANAGGFFWRFQGETHQPWPDPEPTNLNPVEQLDFETGDFLHSYASLSDAKKALGMRPNSGCIREVCNGEGRASARGYFWRWKGSKTLPNHLMGVQKIIQIRKSRGGEVVREFRTSKEAQAFFGHQCCWSTICNVCRGKSFYKGYYWQYRMLKEKKASEMEVIGKRLRVCKRDNEWLEGKITAFHLDSRKYEIQYDCGTIEQCKLDQIQYEWKNDQGQKPIEQLDLKTGVVIATYRSISEAAGHVGDKSATTRITAVCNGRYRSSCGYFWRYKGSDKQPSKPKSTRKVEQLCLKTGRVIDTFDTIAEAGKAVGITTPGISYCCNGRNNSKSAGGFGWRFKVDG